MNVLVVSQSFMVTEALERLFSDIFKDISISIVSDANKMNDIKLHKIDFAFIEANKNKLDTLNILSDIRKKSKDLKLMVLDQGRNKGLFLESIKLGVNGYILNVCDKDEFVYIVNKVVSGKKFYDSDLLQESLKKENLNYNIKLTKKEKCVLVNVCKGLTNKEIAQNLNVTDYTIKKHVSSILSKLNLKSRQAIINYARENDILSTNE